MNTNRTKIGSSIAHTRQKEERVDTHTPTQEDWRAVEKSRSLAARLSGQQLQKETVEPAPAKVRQHYCWENAPKNIKEAVQKFSSKVDLRPGQLIVGQLALKFSRLVESGNNQINSGEITLAKFYPQGSRYFAFWFTLRDAEGDREVSMAMTIVEMHEALSSQRNPN